MRRPFGNAALAALALAVCDPGVLQAQARPPAADGAFLTEAAQAGVAELELGRLAVEKATRADVKAFAQTTVDDHTKANVELKALAARKKVSLPSDPTAPQKATKDRLGKLSGAEFDNAYIDVTVSDYQKTVALFSREAKTGADSDARAWAQETLPMLEEHYTKAKALARTAPQARP